VEASRRTVVLSAAVASVVVFFCYTLLDAAVTLAWSRLGQRMVYSMSGRLFMQLQRLSLISHARRSVGDSLARITGDAYCVYGVTEGLLITPLRQLMTIASVGVLAWQLDRRLTWLLLIAIPLLAASAYHFGHLLRTAERYRREAAAQLAAFVHQIIGAMPLVQAYAAESRHRRAFDALAGDSLRAARRGAWLSYSYESINGLATTIGIALVIYVGSRGVLAGTVTIGGLLVFVAYVRSLEAAWLSLLKTYATLRAAEASVDRVADVLDEREIVRDTPGAPALPPCPSRDAGHLVFDAVTFGYQHDHPVLRDFSLDVPAGRTVALLGASGAGKSTVASLVPRFFDPWQGRVQIDGVDVRDATLASLRAEVALVLQDAFILPLSVADNIAYGRPTARREDIVAAAVAANAHEFVRQLPQGYDTVLDEQGANLSGGQRQRIAIARALLKNPRILILDEPTSALDAETDAEVMLALTRLMAGRTTLIIAHRLSTVRNADLIAVIEQGAVAEIGTHRELLSRRGSYARLYALSALHTGEIA
jgi:ATP-binding cassette subfamily B protein/subfamily B ATP-binding cassette protein MsbA